MNETASPNSNVMLPREYALVLLRKLADDDEYRHSYECNPVHALREIGVPDALLGTLPPTHNAPVKLADKRIFREALYQLIDEIAGVCICHTPPHLNFAVGAPQDQHRKSSTTSFGEP